LHFFPLTPHAFPLTFPLPFPYALSGVDIQHPFHYLDSMLPVENITSKIYFIRKHKVMLDRDLAELYGVEVKQLKRSVRRNIDRFPSDFMFMLSKKELENWRCQFGTSNNIRMGLRYSPMAFTEQGV